MIRQYLSDRSGRWFDLERAEKFDEGTYWDGENLRSKATKAIWTHQTLYRSCGGRWILRRWSRLSDHLDHWEEISAAEAAKWLITNDYEELPQELREHAANLQVA